MSDSNLPTFSVIVPTYNRPASLKLCLAALAAMNYPKDHFEVIVVDDGGTSDLLALINSFSQTMNLRCVRQDNAGPAAARNTGAAAAKNDFLAFTDDDCAAHQNWLMQLAAALTSDRTTLIGGQRRNAMPENFCCTASQMIIDVVNVHFNHDHQNATFFPSDNMAMARQQFLEIGGFDTTFRCSEDRDLCDRWSARGWRLVFAPDAVVDHAREMGLWGFCKQHFGYGRGAWRFHKTRKMRGRGNVQVEGSFYLKCFREPFRTEPLRRAILLAMLLVIWQLVNTAGFFFEAFKSPGSAQTSDFKSASTIR